MWCGACACETSFCAITRRPERPPSPSGGSLASFSLLVRLFLILISSSPWRGAAGDLLPLCGVPSPRHTERRYLSRAGNVIEVHYLALRDFTARNRGPITPDGPSDPWPLDATGLPTPALPRSPGYLTVCRLLGAGAVGPVCRESAVHDRGPRPL